MTQTDQPPSFEQTEGGTSNELPPAYDTVTASSDSASPSAVPPANAAAARRVPPPGTQRARAPLSIIRQNSAIKEDYVVAIGENKSFPDVHLESTNGAIDSTIFLSGEVPRPAQIEAKTTNGTIRFRVQRSEGQAVDTKVKTTNSRVHVWLPSGFNGIVTAKTTNAKSNLSPSLREGAILWPGESGRGIETWAVRASRPGVPADSKDKEFGLDDEPGPDRLYAESQNATINIYKDGEEESTDNDKCIVA